MEALFEQLAEIGLRIIHHPGHVLHGYVKHVILMYILVDDFCHSGQTEAAEILALIPGSFRTTSVASGRLGGRSAV